VSQVIPLTPPTGGNTFAFYLAIAFLAGFSERFIPDLTSSLERTYVTKVKMS
jgi:hypothetical protein